MSRVMLHHLLGGGEDGDDVVHRQLRGILDRGLQHEAEDGHEQ
jgi:hypothetical protein